MKRPKTTALAGALALIACSQQPDGKESAPPPTAAAAVPTPAPATLAASPSPPDLARCRNMPGAPNPERMRKAALPLPASLAAIARSSPEAIAVASLAGDTVCVDTRWIEDAETMTLSADGRFLGFAWNGYEAGGYVLVDRAGKGQALDTGVAPTFSPGRSRLAAIEISESGFGSLNAFLVMQVGETGLRELARLEEIPIHNDWRIDRWVGEICIELSAIPQDRVPENEADRAGTARDKYVARPAGRTWTLAPGTCKAA